MARIPGSRTSLWVIAAVLALVAAPAAAAPKAGAKARSRATPAAAAPTVADPAAVTGVAEYSPDGVAVMPMRVKAKEQRAHAAVKAFERRRAANAPPRSMLPSELRRSPGAKPPVPGASPSAGGGAGLRGAAQAVLALALAQTAPPDLYAVPNFANSPLPVATCSDSGAPCVADSDCPGYAPPSAVGFWLVPEGETCTGPVQSGGIRKFVDQLPGLCGVARPETAPDGKNALGQCLPIAEPDRTTFGDADYYEIGVKDFFMQFHSDLPATTKVRGYYQKNASGEPNAPHYLGPVILATRDRPVRAVLVNEVETGEKGNLFVPVDPTIHGAGLGPDGVHAYAQNRATFHLHGGNTPWISDGTQHQWTVPAGEDTPYKKGLTTANVPDMWFDASGNRIDACNGLNVCPVDGATNDPGDGKMTFYWTNQQSGRFMFYHDHAYGITRLNVYAGEAAGYLLVDPADEAALATATVPGTITGAPETTDLAHMLPLVIQDKSFVPPPAQLAAQDPTWDVTKWGGEGSLWFPHVYTPNQWPGSPDGTGANPMGRWDYGPWFWPPLTSLSVDGVSRPMTQPCTSLAAVTDANPTGATECPTIPTPSLVPEAFMDTMVVNGTAYPTVTIDPVAYRFQILNAANERNLNLSFFVADASGTEVPMVDAVPHTRTSSPPLCSSTAPVSPVTGLPVGCWPRTWPIDTRVGGVPDPAAAGPAIVQLGSEGGILPAPAVIHPQPVNYEYNRRNIVVLNVSDKGLFVGPAERADVVVDFSAYAGKTLILYNDAPAPVPAADPRLDYFTGVYDQTLSGGAPTVHAGYGPNTRTIMQVKVRAQPLAPATPFDPAKAATALASRFRVSQPAPIVPESAYNPVYGTSFGDTYVPIQGRSITFTPVCALTNPPTCSDPPVARSIEFAWKAIHELFETEYGRMDAVLGVEVPLANFLNQTTIPYFNFDPNTEFIEDDKPQIWKITHNGVDTHTIHFHLLNAQVINRVGWDGQIRPPDANEQGWKESVRMHPLEDIYVALRPVRQKLPWPLPDMHRPLDVTRPLGSTTQFTGVDINNNPIPVENTVTNFGWEYVWHCHLLGHEENDMLRAEVFVVAPEAPTGLSAISTTAGATTLGWRDESRSAMTYTIERDTSPYLSSPALASFSIAASTVQPGPASWTDTAVAPNTTYWYRVRAEKTLSSPAMPGVTYPAVSGWSNVFQSGTAPKASVAPTALVFAPEAIGTTSAPQRVTLSNGGNADLIVASASFTGANAADFQVVATTCGNTVVPGASCTYDVAFTAGGLGARTASFAIASNDPWNPTLTVALTGAGPSASVAPAAVAFGDQLINTTSAVQSVTLSNAGPNALSIASISVTGANAAEFAASGTCGASLAAGASCRVDVTFTPTTINGRVASLAIATSDAVYPTLSVALGGTGMAPQASAGPASLTFTAQYVATASASQRVTVTNTGTSPLTISAVTVGGPDASDFAMTGTCLSLPVVAAAGASCTIDVTFTPSAMGTRTANVAMVSDSLVSPTPVTLTGTGIQRVAEVSPGSLLFGKEALGTASAAQAVTVSNAGNTPLAVTSIAFAGTNPGDFVQTNNCGASVPAGASCVVSVSFKPLVAGSRGATLAVKTNDPVNPQLNVSVSYTVTPATTLAITAAPGSPYLVNQTGIVFTATGGGSTTNGAPTPAGDYEYRFWLDSGAGPVVVQNYGAANTWAMTSLPAGSYRVIAHVRTSSTAAFDARAELPYVIRYPAASGVTMTASLPSPQVVGTPVTFTAEGQGSSNYQYRFWLDSGAGPVMVQDYGAANTWTMASPSAGSYRVIVHVRTNSTAAFDARAELPYVIRYPAATGVTMTASLPSPQVVGTPVTFTAEGQGSSNYQYRFWLDSGAGPVMVQDYGAANTWTITSPSAGSYRVIVHVRTSSTAAFDARAELPYVICYPAATGVTMTASFPSPQVVGTPVTFTAEGQGSSNYQYRFWLDSGSGPVVVQDYGAANTWTMASPSAGSYRVIVHVRTNSTAWFDARAELPYILGAR